MKVPISREYLKRIVAFVIFPGDQTVVVQEAETKNPVVIQLHEGHGSAVLCLIDLTFLDDYPTVKLQDQEEEWDACLKKSRNSRIGLLSNILQFLGINCQPQNAPELTPLLLLARKIVSISNHVYSCSLKLIDPGNYPRMRRHPSNSHLYKGKYF